MTPASVSASRCAAAARAVLCAALCVLSAVTASASEEPAVQAPPASSGAGAADQPDEIESAPPPRRPVKEHRAEVRVLDVGGVARQYRLYVPIFAKPGRALPLVIVLHGARGHSEQIERTFGFNAIADREDLAVVYPQGLDSIWNDGREAALRRSRQAADADDAGFLRKLVAELTASGIADRSRVYLAGESSGGFMVARMACEAADGFAAFAILLASSPRRYRTTCNPAGPPPVMLLNGTEDRLVPWEGFVPKGQPRDGPIGLMSAAEHAAFWAERNGCVAVETTKLNDTDPGDGSTIVRSDWSKCKPGGATTFYEVAGGGHQTPSPRSRILDQVIASLLGPRNRDVEAAELVWDFFKRFGR